jgi:hypothetical protein
LVDRLLEYTKTIMDNITKSAAQGHASPLKAAEVEKTSIETTTKIKKDVPYEQHEPLDEFLVSPLTCCISSTTDSVFAGNMEWHGRPRKPFQLDDVAEVDRHPSYFLWRAGYSYVWNDDGSCSRADRKRPAYLRVNHANDSLDLRSKFRFWSNGSCTHDRGFWQKASVARLRQLLHSLEHSLWLLAQQRPDDCQSFSLRLGSEC